MGNLLSTRTLQRNSASGASVDLDFEFVTKKEKSRFPQVLCFSL